MHQDMRYRAQFTRRELGVLLSAALGGCDLQGGTPAVLTPVPGPMLTGAPQTVAVRSIGLPQAIPGRLGQQASDMEVPSLPLVASWGQPLYLMIGRVLAQNLMQRLPGTRVFVDPLPPFTPCDTWIELTVFRFDTNMGGDALVQAQVQVGGLRLLTRTAWKRVTPAGSSPQAMAVAFSIALGQFSDLVAVLVVESWAVAFR